MSKESIQEFYNYVQTQPEIQQELNSLIGDRKALLDKAIELGQQNNYSFTKEELEQAIANLEAAYSENSELSDEQLEAVAGGKGVRDTYNKGKDLYNEGKSIYDRVRSWF